MVRAGLVAAVVLAACLLFAPATAHARASQAPQEPSGQDIPVIIAAHGSFGRPLRLTGGIDVLLPFGRLESNDGYGTGQGLEISARAGLGGYRFAAGHFITAFPFVADALVTMTRTSDHPRVADPRSTYLGGEAGLTLPLFYGVGSKIASVKFNLGYSRRLGDDEGAKKQMFTWSIGTQIYLWWRERSRTP